MKSLAGLFCVAALIGPVILAPGVVLAAERAAQAIEVVRADSHDWPMYNHDPAGTRSTRAERRLGPSTVAGLREQWRFPTVGTVAGVPAVVQDVVYVIDSRGTAYAIGRDGREKWRTTVDVPTLLGPKVTASALVTNRTMIFGDQAGFVHGLDIDTGVERWRVRPNPHPAAAIFGSATFVGGMVALGISSVEELFAGFPGYACCTFRGSVVLLDPADGHVAWQTFLVSEPEQHADGSLGPSGAPVWSTPTYDAATKTVYVTTGNNYSEPSSQTSDAILALDAADGEIRWINQRTGGDVANVTTPPEDPAHPDFDFGDSPQLYRVGSRKVVGAGQKSGFYHAVDATTGALIDTLQVAPAGGLGGLFADTAVAGDTIYANGTHWPFVYAGGPPLGGTLTAVSGDASDLLWRFSTPMPNLSGVAVANRVVYFQSLDGFLYALDARDGSLRAKVQTGGQFGGPAISRGHIYLATGDILTSLFNPFLEPGPGSVIALGTE